MFHGMLILTGGRSLCAHSACSVGHGSFEPFGVAFARSVGQAGDVWDCGLLALFVGKLMGQICQHHAKQI